MIQNITKLLDGGWKELDFIPFRDGVTIHWIRQDFPQIALLKYEPDASVPSHRHTGLETIFVLSGEQTDHKGTICKGDLTFNEAGSEHSVYSKIGCTILIQWEKPIELL